MQPVCKTTAGAMVPPGEHLESSLFPSATCHGGDRSPDLCQGQRLVRTHGAVSPGRGAGVQPGQAVWEGTVRLPWGRQPPGLSWVRNHWSGLESLPEHSFPANHFRMHNFLMKNSDNVSRTCPRLYQKLDQLAQSKAIRFTLHPMKNGEVSASSGDLAIWTPQ